MAITRWIHSIIILPFGIGELCLCCTVLDCKPGDVDDDSNSNNLQRIEALGVDLQQGDITTIVDRASASTRGNAVVSLPLLSVT